MIYSALLSTLALMLAIALDMVIGDPESIPHPVQLMGKWISFWENMILGPKEGHFAKGDETQVSKPDNIKKKELLGGFFMVLTLVVLCVGIAEGLLKLSRHFSVLIYFFLYLLMCWQILAAGSMSREANNVEKKLKEGDLKGARQALSRIVGRDTENLSEGEVISAAVESVAESTADGVINPLFYLALFGPPGGFAFKGVNTVDSMAGYHNERYEYFGKAGARLDDILGFLPSRMAGVAILISGYICGLYKRGVKTLFEQWGRFRNLPSSPNAGQTEAAMALVLGIELGGTAYYAGKEIQRPRLGVPGREPEIEDISRAIKLMYYAEALCLLFFLAITFMIGVWTFGTSVLWNVTQ